MSKKHSGILEELDLQDVEGFTEAQKNYYTSLGFRPYLSASGRVKWLSPELHSRRINKIQRRNFLQRLLRTHPKLTPNRRKHRSDLVKFLKVNWVLILIITVIILVLGYFMINPQILIGS